MTAWAGRPRGSMDCLGEHVMIQEQMRDEPVRDPEGTLYRPGRGGRIHGDQPGPGPQPELLHAGGDAPGVDDGDFGGGRPGRGRPAEQRGPRAVRDGRGRDVVFR